MKKTYDIIIIGSGLGGLVCANILANEGYSVCVLEKNNQYGGNLQTFVRDKTIFDTGVHYIGGLEKGQNLYKYFNYLGIISDLKLEKMDTEFDRITFGNDPKEYAHVQGFKNFKNKLLSDFPKEKKAVESYFKKLKETTNSFPLYNIKSGKNYFENTKLLSLNAKEYLNSITDNKKLKAVLAGSNILYAGDGAKTPFFVHALATKSYIKSAYRCLNGGSQIAKLLLKKLKKNNGQFYKNKEVSSINVKDNKAVLVKTKQGDIFKGKQFISNIEPAYTLKMIYGGRIRKSYFNRINSIESVISAFSLYIVFKPKTFKYLNYNIYHFKNSSCVFTAQHYTKENWPLSYMISLNAKKKNEKWANNMTILTYMNFDDVKEWEHTFNTTGKDKKRGKPYEEFKKKHTEKILNELEKKYPNIRQCIKTVYASTPLSYRDYIGTKKGTMYGYVKNTNNPLKSLLPPKTKIDNLFFTGQSLNMHGVLGVTISGVVTCSEILGKEYLINKINEANKT